MKPSMMSPAAMPAVIHIPDVQNSADTRRLAINKVGIKDIRHPVRVRDRSGGEQHTIATFNMYVLGDNVDAFTVYGCETLADAIESAQSHMDDIVTASDEFLSGESS